MMGSGEDGCCDDGACDDVAVVMSVISAATASVDESHVMWFDAGGRVNIIATFCAVAT
jgi:hypothetical protein